MQKGTCIRCGSNYARWALNHAEQLTCECGGIIVVCSANRKRIFVPSYARRNREESHEG